MTQNGTLMRQDDVIDLNNENLSEALADLPRRVAFVMRNLTLMKYGSVQVTVPGGKTFRFKGPNPGHHGEAVLHTWGLVRRVLTAGSMGAAESYIEGEWDSPDVTQFLELFLENSRGHGADGFFQKNFLVNFVTSLRHWMNRNSKRGSKRNIAAHYDLGNTFYAQWLDPSMTYSSGIFRDGANSLEESQDAKYKSLAERTGIEKHHHVLEIGCGWGGFAEYVAKNIGCKVTCLTISQEQYDFAKARMQKAGLSDLVTIKFQDYRDETGLYDRIASIEMFEAVGEQYWDSYFSQVKTCLKPGGRAGVQIITIKDEDFEGYRKSPDFIQKYIFPGGMLPTAKILTDLGAKFDLKQVSTRAFGYDYAETLEEWRHRFWKAWPTIEPLGFDTRFKRMWEFYFHYCEAGFKSDTIDVRQIVYERV
ncbi:class I SAM-dependent methyltransferase [Pseudahrensia aquimaris]|uniref:Class I SAM-dependent methyltransferase n=1 Tax=Pseudahrensia aquimaris TaxID=744461 RepID=A0ABW3FG44_9HYPH